MSIEKSKKKLGIFIVRYSKRHPITRKPIDLKREAKSFAEAKRIERELVLEVEKRLSRQLIPAWSEMLMGCIADMRMRGLTEKTTYDCQKCLEAHTLEAWSDRLVNSITTQEVKELISKRVGERSQGHQKYILKGIRMVFNFALEGGYIQRNPTPQMKFKPGDKIRMVLTEPQVKLLLSKAKELNWDWYPHLAMAIYTGLRNGELYALEWDRVNLDNRQILVNCAWNNKDGFKDTKSNDDRIVEIAQPLLPILKELKLQTGPSNFVLPRLEKWDRGGQALELRIFLGGIGLPRIRFHDLRATWATLLLSHGVEPIKVMKMGGWKNIETLMIYARKAGVDIKGAMDCLNDLHDPEMRSAKVLQFSGNAV